MKRDQKKSFSFAQTRAQNDEQAAMQYPCRGCYYYSGWNCDYILFEGHRRPCPPGDRCTVKSAKKITPQERVRLHGLDCAMPSWTKRKKRRRET